MLRILDPFSPIRLGWSIQTEETVALTNTEFVDLDGDGDLDFIGLELPTAYSYDSAEYEMNLVFQENEGSASEAAFGPAQSNPFGFDAGMIEGWDQFEGVSGVDFDVVDLDQDGDFDIVGSYQYAYLYNYNPYSYAYLANAMFWVENTGTPTSPQFGSLELNPFGLDVAGSVAPKDSELYSYAFECADIDGDGDIDFLGTLTDYSGDPLHSMRCIGVRIRALQRTHHLRLQSLNRLVCCPHLMGLSMEDSHSHWKQLTWTKMVIWICFKASISRGQWRQILFVNTLKIRAVPLRLRSQPQ